MAEFDDHPTPPMAFGESDRGVLERQIAAQAKRVDAAHREFGELAFALKLLQGSQVSRDEHVTLRDEQRAAAAIFYSSRMQPLERLATRTHVIAWVALAVSVTNTLFRLFR